MPDFTLQASVWTNQMAYSQCLKLQVVRVVLFMSNTKHGENNKKSAANQTNAK